MSNTKLSQYTHRPNMTELGLGNTHETYMLISTDTDLSHIFPPSIEVMVRDVISGKRYALRSTNGREFRVNQMAEIYRDYNVLPGDEIVITKIEKDNTSDICVNVRQYSRIVIMAGSNGAEIVNIDRLTNYQDEDGSYKVSISDRGNTNLLSLKFKESRKKRQDSPNETDYYDVTINGENLANGTYYLTLGDPLSSLSMLPKSEYNEVIFNDDLLANLTSNNEPDVSKDILSKYRPFITAIKSKPFLLLAGISGTGKSRIVRELARSCWSADSDEFKAQKPSNFEMVQVKPNWHDSSELIGYVSRVSGSPVFVAGDFLKFVAKAWENPEVPYFLCLDEMNLAPVEQYFAEYLSVVESRKAGENGVITTDPILKPEKERDVASGNLIPKKWYSDLVMLLLADCPPETMFALKTQFENDGITIPQNLIVVGTVNMDETTFSFSRKVLDRAMTIEMNEVNLDGGLSSKYEVIGKLGKDDLIGTAVEGVDVYEQNKEVCDQVINYLQKVNDELEGTPFKVAYRTRNEFLLYVINNLPYCKLDDGTELTQDQVIARALDEITSMKILSRIEGDESKVKKSLLESLKKDIKAQLESISEKDVFVAKVESETTEDGKTIRQSISLAKLDEMIGRLDSGYTSFWA